MWLGMWHMVCGSTPRRRQTRQFGGMPVSGFESLEQRLVLSCLEPGRYEDPGSPNEDIGPSALTINADNERGEQIAFFSNDDFTNVRMKVICKKKGEFTILKVDSRHGGPKGKISISEEIVGGRLVYHGQIHDKQTRDSIEGVMTRQGPVN